MAAAAILDNFEWPYLTTAHDLLIWRASRGHLCYSTAFLFIFATVPYCAYHGFALYLGKLVDSVHCIAGQSNANMSWIFLEIPSGNLEICSVKFVDTLLW